MERTVLKGFHVTEVSAANKKKAVEKIALDNKYNYNMRVINDTLCVGEFKVTVSDKNDFESFNISATCNAAFEHAKEKNITELHMETMAEMFPYVKAFISTLTTNMGMPPVMIPPIDYGNMSIINVNIPPQ